MTPTERANEIERWFLQRGVPHLIESDSDASILDTWTRALPLLVVAYLLLGLNALDIREWSLAQNLAAAVAVIAMLLAAWVLSNRLRGVAAFARPTDIDAPELALFVFGPAIPVLVFGQVRDAIESVILALVLLLVIYLWSSYGVGALLRWGARRSSGQLTGLGPLVAKALPLLLVFNTFLFVNAEVWEMAGTLDGAAYVVVVLTFFSLGAVFVVSRLPGFIRHENRFDSWADIGTYVEGTPAEAVELPSQWSDARSVASSPTVQHRSDRAVRPGTADHARRRRPHRVLRVLRLHGRSPPTRSPTGPASSRCTSSPTPASATAPWCSPSR